MQAPVFILEQNSLMWSCIIHLCANERPFRDVFKHHIVIYGEDTFLLSGCISNFPQDFGLVTLHVVEIDGNRTACDGYYDIENAQSLYNVQCLKTIH